VASLALSLEPVVSGLAKPIYATHAGDGSGTLYTASLDGFVQTIDGGVIAETPFLDLRSRMTSLTGEQGFYSLAFHPDYRRTGRLFVSYTERGSGNVIVAEYRASGTPPTVAPGAEERILLQVAVDEPLHHGGQLAFGPDGHLYVGIGDGIRSLEILQRRPWPASDLGDLRGKLLRLDTDCGACGGGLYGVPADNPFIGVAGARPEVWALGFRNPWKFSFDRTTGHLYLGDVGNDRWEEVNRVVPAGDYGWPRREGEECLRLTDGTPFAADCDTTPTRAPLAVYGHPQIDPAGGNAITGGYVYRGSAQPALVGRYLYADWVSGRIWSLDVDGNAGVELLLDTDLNISSFVEDEAGELYLLEIGGTLYRIAAVSTSR
jgi:glucose/arabinose dehydrogenase